MLGLAACGGGSTPPTPPNSLDSDTAAPTLTSSQPANNAVEVTSSQMVLNFSEPKDTADFRLSTRLHFRPRGARAPGGDPARERPGLHHRPPHRPHRRPPHRPLQGGQQREWAHLEGRRSRVRAAGAARPTVAQPGGGGEFVGLEGACDPAAINTARSRSSFAKSSAGNLAHPPWCRCRRG